jgi:hypothetical protein
LPQGNTSIIGRDPVVRVHLEIVSVEEGKGFFEKKPVLKDAAAQGNTIQAPRLP